MSNDGKIDLVREIVKGGVSVILAVGLIAFLCFQSYIQYQQLDTLREKCGAADNCFGDDFSNLYWKIISIFNTFAVIKNNERLQVQNNFPNSGRNRKT